MIETEKQKYFPESVKSSEPMMAVDEAPKQSEPMKDDNDINYELEDTDSEEEEATGLRFKKKKPQFTNDDLFYDPDMDEEDQKWVNKHRKT